MDYKTTPEPIPANIQKAIEKFKQRYNKIPEEPKTIYLKSTDDPINTEYNNAYIVYPPGGTVGDKYWNIQYMHNVSVKSDYENKLEKFKNPSYAPETYIVIEDVTKVNSICEYSKEILINSTSMEMLYAVNEMYDMQPLPCFLRSEKIYYYKPIKGAKCMIKYNDRTEKEAKIYEYKYDDYFQP